jgi:hypothetical protein
VETLPINTTFLTHKFSFRTKRFKRKASTKSFKADECGEWSPVHKTERLLTTSRQTESHRNERDPEAVQVRYCMVE